MFSIYRSVNQWVLSPRVIGKKYFASFFTGNFVVELSFIRTGNEISKIRSVFGVSFHDSFSQAVNKITNLKW